MVFGGSLTGDIGAGCCEVRYQVIGINVVRVEYSKFAACLFPDLLPYLFTVLQL